MRGSLAAAPVDDARRSRRAQAARRL